jgi:hypothetical protein
MSRFLGKQNIFFAAVEGHDNQCNIQVTIIIVSQSFMALETHISTFYVNRWVEIQK